MKKWDKPHGFSWLGKIQSTLPNAKIAPSSSQDRKGHCLWVCSKNRQLDEAFFQPGSIISMHSSQKFSNLCIHQYHCGWDPSLRWPTTTLRQWRRAGRQTLCHVCQNPIRPVKLQIRWFLKTEATCMCLRAIRLRMWLGFKGSFCGTKNMNKFHSARLLSICTTLNPATIWSDF